MYLINITCINIESLRRETTLNGKLIKVMVSNFKSNKKQENLDSWAVGRIN